MTIADERDLLTRYQCGDRAESVSARMALDRLRHGADARAQMRRCGGKRRMVVGKLRRTWVDVRALAAGDS